MRLGLALLLVRPLPAQERVAPHAGLVITKSVQLVPGVYGLPAPGALDSAAIVIRGNDITVDARGVTLAGASDSTLPDAYRGVAIRIEGGHGVRILGAKIHGYRFGILANGTHGLVLDGLDVSRTWKPRLFSLVDHESLVDWLSFHHNENGEWLRYGAGIYLESVDSGDITRVTGEGGMNGLMLARSTHVRIWDNDFSFNSGLGIGLYRSSENNIQHNRLDYDIRGYSKLYHRGQDSAGLLLFEQSSRNIIAWNSVTHGGDGLFLWAGQSTMDSGEGGCNDNLIYGNDFSYAAANGIEVTFSRNTIVANGMVGNDYGIWGGYSYGTRILGNGFALNRTGIAIEHGQDNRIAGNDFRRDLTGISLWADSLTPSDWGYPKHRDVRSRGYDLDSNRVLLARVAFRVRSTDSARIIGNTWIADSALVLRDTSATRIEGNRALPPPYDDSAWDSRAYIPPGYGRFAPTPLSDTTVPRTLYGDLAGSGIIVDQWGPYRYRTPMLWPFDSTTGTPVRLDSYGPFREWVVVGQRGIEAVSPTHGRAGDALFVTPMPDSTGDWGVTLQTVEAKPQGFGYSHFAPAIDWSTRFFVWTDSTDPRSKHDGFQNLIAGTPILTRHESRLDYEWYAPAIKSLPVERWALEATGAVDLGPGTYSIRTISDDAIRVWADDRLVIDDWTPHESVVDHAVITGGHHRLRVQYYQVDGWTELRLDIVRGVETSTGSPGPH
ncbi:MAG TPA: NosD domain-containing protein [Gemmatimonadales bacterium]|nr:NosD domain-containing protein [Gemmatimonadales bacterium]